MNKPTHPPHMDGHISSDEAIDRIMQNKGMTRRNAKRWLASGIRSGKLKVALISKDTLERVDKNNKEIADMLEDEA